MLGVVGIDLDRFIQGFSAITCRIQLNRNFPLAARRDLPREGGNDAPSPSFDPIDI